MNYRADIKDDEVISAFSKGITQTDLANELNCHPTTILRRMKKHGLGMASFKPKPDLSPSEELSYVLGVIFGDGYITKTRKGAHIVGLHVMDLDFAEAFRTDMSKILKKNAYLYKYEKTNAYRTEFSSKTFYTFIKDTSFPTIIEIASWYPQQFIKGFFDSEGTVDIRKYDQPRIEIYNQKREYLDSINHLLFDLGIRSVVRFKRQESLMYRLCVEDKNSCRLFAEKIGSSITRKNLKLQQIIEQQTRRTICPICLTSFVIGTRTYKMFCCRKHEKKFNKYKREHGLTREQTARHFKELKGGECIL